jgi:hypothetical protein
VQSRFEVERGCSWTKLGERVLGFEIAGLCYRLEIGNSDVVGTSWDCRSDWATRTWLSWIESRTGSADKEIELAIIEGEGLTLERADSVATEPEKDEIQSSLGEVFSSKITWRLIMVFL